jgi:transposase
MVRFVGLDVHRRVVEACILDDGGRIAQRTRFDLTRDGLGRFAEKTLRPEDRVVLEATMNTWAVVALLRPHVAEVVVSNPMKTRAIAEARIKTDKVDAHILAQLLRLDFLPRVWQPDEATQEMRRLTRRRITLVRNRVTVKNRIHSILIRRLIQPPVTRLFCLKGLEWLRTLELDEEGQMMVESDFRLMESLDREIEALDELLARKAYADPRVRLLMTLPGVDVRVAQAVVAALGDVERFRDADHAASYLGLVPSTKQSANHCYHGPITKAGNRHARWMLSQAAQHLGKNPGPLGAFYRRVRRRKCHQVAVMAAARKIVVIAWHMLTNEEPYRYAIPQTTEAKLVRLRCRAEGKRRTPGRRPQQRPGAKPNTGRHGRTVRSLPQVLERENLPPTRELRPGERRVLREEGLEDFHRSIQQERLIESERSD